MADEEWKLETLGGGVEEYLRALPEPTRSKVDAYLKRLRLLGNRLGRPHTRAVGGGLMELKVPGQNAQRVYFAFRPARRIVILGLGSKKTQAADIEAARAKMRLLT